MAFPASLHIRTFALGSTLWIASAMATTSLIFVPALLRPLEAPSRRSASKPEESTHALPTTDGRLTPQPSGVKDASSSTTTSHKLAAQQFAAMDALAFRAQVPLELLIIAAYGWLAYDDRRRGWKVWALSAGLMAAVFPFTGALMVPYVHKLARLAGAEEKVEPYEDSPLDTEAEKYNVAEFLIKWNALNGFRTALVLSPLVLWYATY